MIDRRWAELTAEARETQRKCVWRQGWERDSNYNNQSLPQENT